MTAMAPPVVEVRGLWGIGSAALRGDIGDMIKAVRAGVLLGAILCIGVGGQALAKGEFVLKPKAKPISTIRFGALNAKVPLVGARLVYRGGVTPMNAMMRPRFVGGMIDIYPSSDLGFRMSVGTRYFARKNFWIAAEEATRGLLYDPHMTRGGRGLMRGYRRYTPAATVGYDISPTKGLVVGVEGGMLTGRAISPMRAGRMGIARTTDDRNGTNRIVTLSARLAF